MGSFLLNLLGRFLIFLGTKMSTTISLPAPAADPLPELTAGLVAVGDLAKVVGQVNAEKNTPAMLQAARAQKIQDLRDRASAAIAKAEQTGDLSEVERLLS